MKHILLPVIGLLLALTGCSMQKMAGNAVMEYTHDEAIPYLMAQGDLQAACQMGQSMGPVVASFSRVELDPSNIGIATNMAAGMCAEFDQRTAELDKTRALFENRSPAAQDALIREKQGHRLAALRMYRGYEDAQKTFGNFSEKCPKFDNKTDELLALLGLASGALGLLHDFNSEKSVGISLDVPGIIEKSASCFDDDKWWGMPTALRASLWMSIPGAGPEGVDPVDALQNAAIKGDKQGVLLARAMLVFMATNIGRNDVACAAISDMPSDDSLNHDWDMLNAYAKSMIIHQADLAWTRAKGYRAPFMQPSCPSQDDDTKLNQDEVDDLLDGLLDDDDEQPAETNHEQQPAETQPADDQSVSKPLVLTQADIVSADIPNQNNEKQVIHINIVLAQNDANTATESIECENDASLLLPKKEKSRASSQKTRTHSHRTKTALVTDDNKTVEKAHKSKRSSRPKSPYDPNIANTSRNSRLRDAKVELPF